MTFRRTSDGALVMLPMPPVCPCCGRRKTGTSWTCECGREPLWYKQAKASAG